MSKFRLLLFQFVDNKFDTQIIDFENCFAYSNYIIDLSKDGNKLHVVYKEEQIRHGVTYVIAKLIINN